MRSRITALRRALRIFLLLVLAALAAYWNWGLFPGKLKQIPIDRIRETTGFGMDFARVHYVPFHGVRIDRPVLVDKNGEELFRAQSIRLATDLPAFLQDNRIVIQKIEVDAPVTQVRLGAAGPAPSPLPVPPPPADPDSPVPVENPVPHPFVVLEAIFDDSFLPSNVYLNELEIRHGKIAILPAAKPGDAAPAEPIETLREIHFRTLLSRRPMIPVLADFRTSFSRGDLHAEGLVNLGDGRHRLSLKGNLDRIPRWLVPALAAKNVTVGKLRGDVAIDLNYDGATLVTFKSETEKAVVEARRDARTVTGEFALKASGAFDFSDRKFRVTDGILEARSVVAKNLAAHVEEVRLTAASVAWNPELIEIPRIRGTWDGTDFTVEGTVDRTESHRTQLKFRQTLPDLGVWQPLAPKVFDHALNLGSLKGHLELEASLAGLPSELAQNIRSIRLTVREGRLQPDALRTPLTSVNGTVAVENLSAFGTEGLRFRHGRNDYVLSGQYGSAPGSAGRFSLSTRKWDVGARFRSFPDRIEFSTLTLQSGDSHAGASGTLMLMKNPVVNADFRAHLVTERFAADWQAEWPWLKNLKLKGAIDAEGHVQGPIQRPNALSARVEARSNRLVYADLLTFQPIETDLRFESGILEIIYARAGFYGGEARLTGRVDLTDPKKPRLQSKLFVQDANLAKFCEKLDFIKNKFSGLLDLDLTLAGILSDPKSLNGEGNFDITGGKLWQTELFKRLRKVAFVTIEGAEKILFDRASGAFKIRDGGLETEDCVMSSTLIDVHFAGRIGFDTSLAMNVVSRFTSGIIREASEVGGLTPALIHIAENKITRYFVSGNFKDPVFTPQS